MSQHAGRDSDGKLSQSYTISNRIFRYKQIEEYSTWILSFH